MTCSAARPLNARVTLLDTNTSDVRRAALLAGDPVLSKVLALSHSGGLSATQALS
jgi:hypothetical protein